MREIAPEEKLNGLCRDIKREIVHWKYINQNGCNDPFWPDGCNMNLTRNHIIYAKNQIKEICNENNIPLPEEYYLQTPPEVDNNYMAKVKSKKQKVRMERIKRHGDAIHSGKYVYDEQQISLFQ